MKYCFDWEKKITGQNFVDYTKYYLSKCMAANIIHSDRFYYCYIYSDNILVDCLGYHKANCLDDSKKWCDEELTKFEIKTIDDAYKVLL